MNCTSTSHSELYIYLPYTLLKMPAAISKPRNKGKARAEPYDTSKETASMPLGKQLAHTGKPPISLQVEILMNRQESPR
jgi:hypothetical protein